ncbi:MAG: carbohydrate ABC transporter permease, partial [Beijerinckiaceae bacterium]
KVRRVSPRRSQHVAAYLLIAPFLLLFLGMVIAPLVYSAWLSLFQARLIGGDVFVGLGNYARALGDPDFLGGFGRVSLFLVVQVPLITVIALVLALALDSGRARGSRALRLLIFMPYAVPGVIAALLWGFLYGDDFGPIAQLFQLVGLESPGLLQERNIIGSIVNIVMWSFTGYNMVVLYSALKAIPAEQYESAEIDGASQLQIAWYIKIPSVRPALLLIVIFSVIGGFQLFTEPSLLAQLAPGAIDRGFSPNYYAYSLAFVSQDLNYAAAISFLLGIVIAVASYVVIAVTSRAERRAG